MREHVHENIILIDRPLAAVHAYVSQPWRWHEWHPASESASGAQARLAVGGQFDETVSMKPVPMLPIRIRQHLRWTVLESVAPHLLVMKATSSMIDVHVRYEIDRLDTTRFRRVFRFQVKGWLAHVEQYFMPARMRKQSIVAMRNLKRVLEADE
ncbi:MAG: SRPBCC family protein [Pseudomonadota bacterium]